MGLLEILVWLALLAVAAVVAMIVRAEDEPKTAWTKANIAVHVKVLIYGFVAAGIVAYVLGYDPTDTGDFVSILAVAYLGIAAVKAIITRAATESSTTK